MARVDVPEIMDQPWCPSWLRDGLTDGIRAAEQVGHPFDGLRGRMAALLRAGDTRRVVDLCAGGGGPALRLFDLLRDGGEADELVLTDLHPNQAAFAWAAARAPGVRPRLEPLDATDVPADLPGLRTVFNAFHHLPEPVAGAVLADAARQRQPFLAVEALAATPLGFATALSVAGVAWAVSPFRRPFDVRRAVCATVLPIVPAVLVWEGAASCLRTYGHAGWRRLLDEVGPTPGYRWELGVDRVSVPPVRLTWLAGWPTT